MKFFVFLLSSSLTAGSIVKREAEPEAKPEADAFGFGYHGVHHGVPVHGVRHHGAYSSAPDCTTTPVKKCETRSVEHPKKVCQTVVDKHEDTVVTEECEETVTTVCTQSTTTAQHSSKVVDTSSTLVEQGQAKPITEITTSTGYRRHIKREAEPVAEAEPFVHLYDSIHSVPHVKNASPPDCTSTPVKNCKKNPHTRPRVVSRVVCDTVVDVTHIEDCKEVVTKTCTGSTTYESRHSAVVGADVKVIGSGFSSGSSSVSSSGSSSGSGSEVGSGVESVEK